jgi:hypothetical protein
MNMNTPKAMQANPGNTMFDKHEFLSQKRRWIKKLADAAWRS